MMRHERSIRLIPDEIANLTPVDQVALRSMAAGGLRQWERLGGECSACRHQGAVDIQHVNRRFGAAPLASLQTLLLCKRCGNRDDNRFTVGTMARD